MEINLLMYFIEIVKSGNFSNAADSLYMNQSTLSKQIKKLEKELGVELFDRSHRTPVLTPAGLTLSKMAPPLLHNYQELVDTFNPSAKTLHIAVLPVMCYYGLAEYTASFSKRYPDIKFSLEEIDNSDMAALFASKTCELAFLRLDSIINPSYALKTLPICKDELALILPKTHPLANRKHVSLRELKNDNFIFLHKDTTLYNSSMNACLKAGFEPNIVYTGSSAESMIQLAIHTNSVAMFMKQIALTLHNPDISVLSFDETIESEIVLAALDNITMSNNARVFWNHMCGLHL